MEMNAITMVVRIVLLVIGFTSVSHAKTPIYVLGLYPISGSWPAGEAILAASRLAAEHVNQDSRILHDYELIIIPADAAVSVKDMKYLLSKNINNAQKHKNAKF